jgi:hypothetical protein
MVSLGATYDWLAIVTEYLKVCGAKIAVSSYNLSKDMYLYSLFKVKFDPIIMASCYLASLNQSESRSWDPRDQFVEVCCRPMHCLLASPRT